MPDEVSFLEELADLMEQVQSAHLTGPFKSVHLVFEDLANWARNPDEFPGMEEARDGWRLCPKGHGHWDWDCEARHG